MFESFAADVCQEDLPVFLDFFAVFFLKIRVTWEVIKSSKVHSNRSDWLKIKARI